MVSPTTDQLRSTQCHERFPSEPAAEQQQPRAVLTLEQQQCLSELPLRRRPILRASGQQSEVQVRHGKTGSRWIAAWS